MVALQCVLAFGARHLDTGDRRYPPMSVCIRKHHAHASAHPIRVKGALKAAIETAAESPYAVCYGLTIIKQSIRVESIKAACRRCNILLPGKPCHKRAETRRQKKSLRCTSNIPRLSYGSLRIHSTPSSGFVSASSRLCWHTCKQHAAQMTSLCSPSVSSKMWREEN